MNTERAKQLQGWGIALIRIIVGIVFLVHGSQKLFMFGLGGTAGFMGQIGIPAPMLAAVLATAAEFLGGLALLLGLLTRWAAIPLSITMLVAILTVHLKNGFFLPTGYEYALTLLIILVGLALMGPGEAALDNLFTRRGSKD
ncbi:MAG TPA: DoxX family protein [Pyrinomonadaceae bacterium]